MKKLIKFSLLAIIVGVLASGSYQLVKHNRNEKNKYESLQEARKEDDDGQDGENDLEGEDTQDDKKDKVDRPDSDRVITNDISTIVDNVMPSIVAINSRLTEDTRDFLGRPYKRESQGSGSGFIIGQNHKELLIITNNHVVNDADGIEIVFNNGKKVEASLRGGNATVDVAVLCVNLDNLSADTKNHIKIATIGNSENVKLGDLSIAIGNALGYGQAVTVGYISAISRQVDVEGRNMELIQTDAAINPGNSGGALLNAKGEVIGINTMKLVGREIEGMGYSIPISEVLQLINQLSNLIEVKESNKAYLGIITQDIAKNHSQVFNMPVGVYVRDVEAGSAADKAGVRKGEIITAINDIPIESQLDLQEILKYIEAGSSGTITVSSLEEGEYTETVLDIEFGSR